MVDNAYVVSPSLRSPRRGRVEVARNAFIEKVEDAGFYDYENMDLRTDNPLILEKFPNLNEVFPKMGLQKSKYRDKLPTRADVGGLHIRSERGDPWEEDRDLE